MVEKLKKELEKLPHLKNIRSSKIFSGIHFTVEHRPTVEEIKQRAISANFLISDSEDTLGIKPKSWQWALHVRKTPTGKAGLITFVPSLRKRLNSGERQKIVKFLTSLAPKLN